MIDVALSDVNHIEQVPEKIKMLVFKRGAGDLVQFEAIIKALRSLHLKRGDIVPALVRLYEIVNNKKYKGPLPTQSEINDPTVFAKIFIFDLPNIAPMEYNEYRELNERMLEILMSA